MENFNNVPSSGTFGSVVSVVNQNFALAKEAIDKLAFSKSACIGFYETSSELNDAHPTPTDGDWALVGDSSPFNVYVANDGSWVDSGVDYNVSVDNSIEINGLGGYVVLDSVQELPASPSNPNLGYLIGTHLYVYVGTGGDALDGKYKDCGEFKGSKGDNGEGIESIEKTGTSGLVDTYTITYTDGSTSTFTVTNGADGHDGVSLGEVAIVNNLTEGGIEKVLSAEQGKVLNLDKISKESAITRQYPELTGVGIKDKVWYQDGSQLKSNKVTFMLFVPVEAGERLTVTGIYTINVFPVSSTMPSAVGDIADFPNDGTINENEITYQHAGYAWLQSTDSIRVTKSNGLIVATKTDGIIPPSENTTNYLDGQLITKETMQNGDIMPSLYNLITPSRNLLDPASFDPISFITTRKGTVGGGTGSNYGIVVVRNIVLNGSFCFSASQQLLPASSGFNGISIQPSAYAQNNTVYAAITGVNFETIVGKGDALNFTLLPDYNGWKITANIEFPCDIYIAVGARGASTNMQFENGDSPTDFVPYGEKIVGTDWSPQISALSQSIVALQAQIDNVKSVPSRWAGCRYVACGDSITDERYSPSIKYCTLLNDALATTSYLNAGASGATLCTVHTNNFVNKVRTLDLTTFDLMTIMLGVNDKGHNTPIGTIDGSDTGTFYGAWNDVISYIITANPRLKVVLLTPFNTGSSSVNSLGLNVKDYADAILAIGTKFSIPVVDCFRNAGICPNNWGTYTLDNLHPNALGHEWAAGYIIAQVKNL